MGVGRPSSHVTPHPVWVLVGRDALESGFDFHDSDVFRASEQTDTAFNLPSALQPIHSLTVEGAQSRGITDSDSHGGRDLDKNSCPAEIHVPPKTALEAQRHVT